MKMANTNDVFGCMILIGNLLLSLSLLDFPKHIVLFDFPKRIDPPLNFDK